MMCLGARLVSVEQIKLLFFPGSGMENEGVAVVVANMRISLRSVSF